MSNNIEPTKEELNKTLGTENEVDIFDFTPTERINEEEILIETEEVKEEIKKDENVFDKEKMEELIKKGDEMYQLFKDGKMAMENSYKHMIEGLNKLAEVVEEIIKETEKPLF